MSSGKAFDIGRIPKNLNLNEPPVTGTDYLFRVRLETRKCPKVVVSNIDTTRFLARQTVLVDPYNGFVRARPGFAPDPIWQDEQLETFRSIRMEVFKNQDELKQKFPQKDLPKIYHEKNWCLFCLGTRLCDEIFEGYRKKVEDTSESKQPQSKKSRLDSEPLGEIKAPVGPENGAITLQPGNPPLLSIVLHMNHIRITKLLAFHVRWLEMIGFSDEQGRWVYALLLCLDTPLEPDTCGLLRSLSRVCSKLRGDLLDPEDCLVKSLNLILSIVSQFFDQKDMSDCFPVD